jgi:hypothetical protein
MYATKTTPAAIVCVYLIFLGDPYSDCLNVQTCAYCRGTGGRAQFRTLDGTCNNINKPTQGAADTKHKRYLGRYLRVGYLFDYLTLFKMCYLSSWTANLNPQAVTLVLILLFYGQSTHSREKFGV